MNYFVLRQIIESSLPWWTALVPSLMFIVFTIIHAALHKPRKLNEPRNKPALTKESRDKYLCQCGQFTDRSNSPLDPFNELGSWNCPGCGSEFTVGDRMRAQERINQLKDKAK